MPFIIRIVPSAMEELKNIRAFDRKRIAKAIDEQLTHEADVVTRNRKMLPDVEPSFPFEPPIWELRVGDFRVFYDIEEVNVFVRAIRAKPPHQTTEQVL